MSDVFSYIDGNAVITATPSNCNNVIRWIVKNGVVGQSENKLLGTNAWGGLDGIATVAPVDETGDKGAVCDFYDGGNCQMYYMPDWSAATPLVSNPYWGYNPGARSTFAHSTTAVTWLSSRWICYYSIKRRGKCCHSRYKPLLLQEERQ